MPHKILMLMRHGKSDWAAAANDFDRPLNKRGRSDTPLVAEWLGKQNLVPERIVSSPAVRASTTAELVAGVLKLSADDIVYDPAVYEAGHQQLIDVISRHAEPVNRILLVGHNPALDELVSFLVTGSLPLTKKGKLMTTAAVAVLQCEDWQLPRSSCRLLELKRPKQLS